MTQTVAHSADRAGRAGQAGRAGGAQRTQRFYIVRTPRSNELEETDGRPADRTSVAARGLRRQQHRAHGVFAALVHAGRRSTGQLHRYSRHGRFAHWPVRLRQHDVAGPVLAEHRCRRCAAAAAVPHGAFRPSDPRAGAGAFSFIYRDDQQETAAKTFSFPIYSAGGRTIPSRSASAGEQDGLDLINALATHPETARRIATKLYGFFISETVTPPSAFIDELATVYLQNGTVMKPVLSHLSTSPQFPDPSTFFTRYSSPVELVVRP